MSRTIADLTGGTEIYIDECVNGEPVVHEKYIYLGLDASGNARARRRYAFSAGIPMNTEDIATYDGCTMDVWLNNAESGFLSRFDAPTLNCLVNTSIKYLDFNENASGEIYTIARKCYLLAFSEVGLTSYDEGSSFLGALKTYYGTDSDSSARAQSARLENETGVVQHFRSARNATQFGTLLVDGSNIGGQNASLYTGSYARYVVPIIAIDPTTPVSDDGAEQIALLPSGSITSWGISATMSLGKSARRPKRCKLEVPMDEFDSTQFWVCNNYMDSSPTWVSCTNGGLATFGTTKTAVDWELGVKVVASDGEINKTIGEPRMIVEFAPLEVLS